jgi:hypothetical protein
MMHLEQLLAKFHTVKKECTHGFKGHIQESKLGGATLFEAGGSGVRLEAPSGSRGRSPRKLLDFRDFIDLKTLLTAENLQFLIFHLIIIC